MNVVKLKKPLIFLGIIGVLSFALQSEEFMSYEVKEHDSLSKILLKYKLLPIYGENGFLKKVLDLNVGKIKNNGDLIRQGIVIILPIKVLEQVTERSIASAEYEDPFTEKEIPLEVVSGDDSERDLSQGFQSKFHQYSYFTLAPTVSSITVNTVDNVNLGGVDVSNTTRSATGVKGEWRVMVRPEQSLFVFSNIDLVNFYNDSKYSLSNTNFTRTTFGVGQEFGINAKSSFETILQSSQNYFLEVMEPDNVQIRQLPQIELRGKYLRNVLQIGHAKSQWGAGGVLILPATRENFKSSLGLGLNLDWTTKFQTNEFQLSYLQKFYKINNMSNQSRELMLNFHFQFGKKE